MTLFSILETLLYQLSALFFYPVIVSLFFLLGRCFYSLGLFAREGWHRVRRPNARLVTAMEAILVLPSGNDLRTELSLTEIINDFEQAAQRPIQRARYSIKMGPTLGLIGTLTPMARALSSLSEGNFAGLSGQMITAFSTTVLGLIVGGLAYTMAHVRAKWQRHDLYILSRLAEEKLV